MLIDWINDELAEFRIIIKDIEEDLFDGQILQKLIGQCLHILIFSFLLSFSFIPLYNLLVLLHRETRSDQGGGSRSDSVWSGPEAEAPRRFGCHQPDPPTASWMETPEMECGKSVSCSFIPNLKLIAFSNCLIWCLSLAIHSKNLVAILHLLVALVRYFRAPLRLPENVAVFVVVVQVRNYLHSSRDLPVA